MVGASGGLDCKLEHVRARVVTNDVKIEFCFR